MQVNELDKTKSLGTIERLIGITWLRASHPLKLLSLLVVAGWFD